MTSAQTSTFRRLAAQYFFGGIGLALLTFVCFQLELGLATTGFLYFLLITLLSLTASFIESAILSVIAVACLNYFFTQPLLDFKVGAPQDVVLVIAFLLTALIVTRLVGGVRKQAKTLRRSETNLAEAQRLSRTGSFGWRVSSGEILWSEETFRIFQYDRTTRPTMELIVQRIHPEDRALVQGTIERASQDGRDFDFEHRLLMPDGSIKQLHVMGHAERDKWDECEFVGAVMDVTAAKEAEERIRQDERELRITLETIPTFVVSTLPDGSVDFVSQGWLDYLGRSREEMLGWSWVQIVHPEDLETVLNSWQAALVAGEPLEIETRIRRADGKYRWFLARAVPLCDEKGDIVKWYATTHDIDDRKQAEQKLRQSEAYLSEAQRLL